MFLLDYDYCGLISYFSGINNFEYDLEGKKFEYTFDGCYESELVYSLGR